jgi:photosystem II stability/assembly factor-like uncharacterized protein
LGAPVSSLAESGAYLFAGTYYGGVFLSTNNGTSWTPVNHGLTDTVVHCLAASGTNLFAGTDRRGLFRSTNNGTSWAAIGSPPTILAALPQFTALVASDSNLFAGANYLSIRPLEWGGAVSHSTDNGATWVFPNLGRSMMFVRALAVSGTNIASGWNDGVFLSTDNGTNWTPISSGLTDSDVWCLAFHGTDLFAGTRGGSVFRWTNNGTAWTAASSGLPKTPIFCFAVNDTDLFVGTGASGVFLSTDNGTTWTAVNSGLTDTSINCLAVNNSSLFAGTDNGVWRRPLSEMVSIDDTKGGLPAAFSLQQNYPNPFNPSTTINFELPRSSDVRLSVFDLLGREVSVLVNERRDAGVHEVKLSAKGGSASGGDGVGLSSGVYFYRLQAGDFVQSKKLLLLK